MVSPRPLPPPSAAAAHGVVAHRDVGAVTRLRSTWEELSSRSATANAFTALPWALAWWRTYGASRELWALEIRSGEGRSVGLAPLQVSRVRGVVRSVEMLGGGPANWRHWLRSPLGMGYAYVNDVLVEPGHEAGVVEALRTWLEHEVRWDTLRLTCVPAQSAIARGFDTLAQGRQPQVTEAPPRLRVDTSRPWEEFRSSLSKRQRQDVRYKPNELVRVAGAELSVDTVRGDGVVAAMEEFIELFARRWAARGKPGLLPREGALYRDLAVHDSRIVVHRLLAGHHLLASQFGFDERARYTPYNYAFEPALHQQSPSHVLMQLVIQQCCEDGHSSVELLPEAMGRHWSKDHQRLLVLEATSDAALAHLRRRAVGATATVLTRAQTTTAGGRARAAVARALATARQRVRG